MLNAKLKYKGGIKTILIPQSFEEIDWKTYLKLLQTDVPEALLGISAEDLGEYALPFYGCVEFLKSNRLRKKAIKTPEWIEQIDIRTETWGKLEKAKQLIKTNKERRRDLYFADVLKVYLPDIELNGLPMGEVLGAMHRFYEKLNAFFKAYERLNDYEPDGDEIMAGIEEMEQHGHFPTLMALTGDNPLDYDKMLEQPANIIYRTLLVKYDRARIEKKLQEIKMKKK